MKELYSIILGIFVFNLIYSNDSIKNKLNLICINSGFGHLSFNDHFASDVPYKSSYMPFVFEWSTLRNKHIDNFSFTYSAFSLKPMQKTDTELTNFRGRYFSILYTYHYIILKRNILNLYLGGGVNGFYLRNKNSYHFNSIGNVQYTTTDLSASLNMSLLSEVCINKNTLLLQIIYPFVNYVAFNKYSQGSFFKGDFVFLPDYKGLITGVKYYIPISDFFLFNIGYNFFFQSYPKFDSKDFTKLGTNIFTIGICLKI